jgi:hypothetical protein
MPEKLIIPFDLEMSFRVVLPTTAYSSGCKAPVVVHRMRLVHWDWVPLRAQLLAKIVPEAACKLVESVNAKMAIIGLEFM